MKNLRSDNGGEYMLNKFKNLCAKGGFQQDLTTPHNPHQNGVAESKNYSIVGASRVIMHDEGLPLHLWVETCNTPVYLQNQSPHWILGMITLEEASLGRKLDVSHFRIFGSFVYFHVSKESRKKLEMTK